MRISNDPTRRTPGIGWFSLGLILLPRLKEAYHREKELSTLDALTGVLNGRSFREQATVEISRKHLRSTDLLARLGGDEFAILLPETGEEPARSALEKISALVSGVLQERRWPVTLSIGAITFLAPPDSVDEMVRRADRLMSLAKHGGKNRIRHEVHGA